MEENLSAPTWAYSITNILPSGNKIQQDIMIKTCL